MIFRNWVLQNFPFLEDDFDGLTDYELFCKMIEYMRKAVDQLKVYDAKFIEFNNRLTELENYINTLDIQDYVNEKLDEMYENGQLESLIEQFIALQTTFTYNNVEEMQEATNLTDNMFVRTSGFYEYNDGGGSYYKVRNITADDTIDDMTIIRLDNNLVIAELIKENQMNVKQFGAKGDGETDDTLSIQTALDYCNNIIIRNGTYMIDASTGVIPTDNTNIEIVNATLKAIPNDLTNYKVLFINNKTNINISGGIIEGERSSHSGTEGEWGHCLHIANSSNIHIKDIILKNAWGDGLYINNVTNITTQNILCDNNRRQGISIIKVNGYHSLNDKIINTNGTSPESAIDIEPNSATDYIKNVIIENLYTENNNGNGVTVYLPRLNNTSDPVSVKILNHHDKGSTTGERIAVPYNVRHTIITENALLENNNTGISLRDCFDNSIDKVQIIRPTILNCNYDTSVTASYVCGISGYTTEVSEHAIGGVTIIEPYITSMFETNRRSISFYDTTVTLMCKNIQIIDPRNHQSNLVMYIRSDDLIFSDRYKLYINKSNSSITIGYGDTVSEYSNINFTSGRTHTLQNTVPIGREITFYNEKSSNRISLQFANDDYIRYFDNSNPGKLISLGNVNSLITIRKIAEHEWLVTDIIGTVTSN